MALLLSAAAAAAAAAAVAGGGGGGGEVIYINEKKINGVNSAAYSRRHAPRRGVKTMLDPPDEGIDVKLITNALKRNGQRKKWGGGIRGGGSTEIDSNAENRSLSGKTANAIGLEGKEVRHDDSNHCSW